MKGYGLPRNDDVAAPDCADLVDYGRKSSAGHLRKKGGEFKNSCRSTANKARARRRYARKARCEGKAACVEE